MHWIVKRFENADDYTGSSVVRQRSNQMKVEFSTSVELKCSLIDHVETWCCSTKINQCRCVFSTSFKSEHLLKVCST
jgi:hypothetical protein